ncbi:STAS domain-containing protein [Actinomadura sp. ATCC 31491]|uniref:STAS domain-containing protein n=1 Tax=Actinomadura luzonensis TaxID=2805427 RepID=A0ABT0FIW4_9ACTN|nr:STAS domain-containing protein [Actinomadura luzonensis]MCK2212241.1 STAS domain-containing protein [Actinomadura luzonensis]
MASQGGVPDFSRVWAIIALHESFDEATVADLEREIRLLSGQRGARLIIEVSGLHFLDGYGIDVLVLLAHHMRRQGGLMAVVDGRGHARHVLGEAGLEDLLPLFPSVSEAMLALSGGEPPA